MYMANYIDQQEESLSDARGRERELMTQSIDLLEQAKEKGANSIEAIRAIHFSSRLWMTLMEDLADNENVLPEQLRANLISIGIWVLKTLDAIRQGRSDNFTGVIEITGIIRDGLK
ncbi:flagellar biosynthesis regulator FlaF [Notoacmeibacter sp. MSK16QG-6]|uniref:flagellar biosynthesis regulator FlaF n=1 Tax=Notoacmeibacter sp. MSK16QG-6 TaxID=2957982 RepID=UPI0020A0E8D1|nr:flagellar biosynthesis regulator FlaF [Notoacmeibacter sp. MSK16QG-6]MCP1200938.1 flagellar biosynthesis regulator FlaF [Notoacmeibacter sp. MSK16QG-6]